VLKIRNYLLTAILLLSVEQSSFGASKNLVLPAPDELHAVPTVLRSSSAIVREKDELFLFGPKLNQYVKIPFHPDAKTRTTRFGEYTQSTRIPVPPTKYPGDWRGIMFFEGEKNMLWDASMLQLVLFFPNKNRVIQETTVPIDMIKPARDSQGEPTSVETAKARNKIRTAYKKVFGSRFSGFSALPSGWLEGKKNYYAMASNIADFPLTIMSCAEDDPVGCVMDRICYLDGGPSIKSKSVAGVGVSKNGKLLLMGDAERHAIHVFHWDSCFNVHYLKSLELPKNIATITSLHIDHEDLLWVTTNKWENQFDSNLYYWEPSQWRD
jgi:hypothetical protein